MRAASLAVVTSLTAGCGGGESGPDAYVPRCDPVDGVPALGLEQIVAGLDMPVYVTSPPGDPDRLFVLEKEGAIRLIDRGVLRAEPFLVIDRVLPLEWDLADERGLLGLAFHPGFAGNGHFFVNYTNLDGDTVVDRYQVSATDPDRADPASRQLAYFLDDFSGNHNGGTLQFGPDGALYVSIGDGGGGDDPRNYAQNPAVEFGKIVRVDVAALPGAHAVWSLGWRNPWRFSFDRATGDMYVGDVGQDLWEEIDVEPAGVSGRNYGWDVVEGTDCHEPATGCDRASVPPVYQWGRDDGCVAIGGYVYRGCAMPALHGTYFFADYCRGWVRSLVWDGAGGHGGVTDWPALTSTGVVSFGEDADGELYLVVQDTGQILKIVPR